MRDRGTFTGICDRAAALMIDRECIGESAGINFDAAIDDRLQVEAVAICRTIIANDL